MSRQYKNTHIVGECEWCKKPFSKPRSECKNSKHLFCSRECYYNSIKGKNHYNYKAEIRKCDYCGKEIEVSQAKLKNHTYHFCNKKCKDAWQTLKENKGKNHPLYKQIKVKCANCGKHLERTSSYLKKSKIVCCDKQCMQEYRRKTNFYKKENNFRWRGGKQETNCTVCGKPLFRRRVLVENKTIFFCSPKCRGEWIKENLSGKNSYSWKGGKTEVSSLIRSIASYKKWILSIYKRDNYQCILCKNSTLRCHHIKSLSNIVEDNKISNIEEAKKCKELWDIDNGITLCEYHHNLFHSIYGKGNNNEEQFTKFINEQKIQEYKGS